MRYIAILACLWASLFAISADELIKNITTPKGVEKSVLSSAKNPFAMSISKKEDSSVKPQFQPPEPTLSLKAIFEKTALINDKWIKQGDKLEGYEIFEINDFSVVLQSKTKRKTLYLFKGRK